MSIFTRDIGIDLGTANTLVHLKGKGIILREPSVVAINKDTKEVLEVGEKAKKMIGRTPGNIIAVRPMRGGVIADFGVTQKMLKHFIKITVKKWFFVRTRIVICIPSGVTEVEKRAVKDSAEAAGANEVFLLEEPMAAAIGANLPVAEASGSMVVDIGGGTCEVAVISLGGIVTSESLRVAGDQFDDSIINYIKKNHNLVIGERTAEDIKIMIGSAFDGLESKVMEIRGRDIVSGLPKSMTVTSEEILEAIREPVDQIIDSIRKTLEKTPPELSSDIITRGITLTGGGALLAGLDKRITMETGMPVNIADNPLECVALGSGMALESMDILRKIAVLDKKKM